MQAELDATLTYLASPAALESLRRDAYWPKWDSPWWHMLLLHEMGLAAQIPKPASEALVDALNALPVKIFPIRAGDMPEGVDPYSGTSCHCAVGNIYGVLASAGVDVSARLPWMRRWLSAYQMADGGMNCDEGAYLVEGECPSSMVALVPCFEALVRHVPDWTPQEAECVERGAQFLLKRELRLGCSTAYNAAERESARQWGEITFPRFYFYDVLRGLTALQQWSARTGRELPPLAVREQLRNRALVPTRRAWAGKMTRLPGTTERRPASTFPLLEAVSGSGKWLRAEGLAGEAT